MNRGDIKLVIDTLDQYANGDEFQREVEMAVDMLERLGNKVAQQAAVIEKLIPALRFDSLNMSLAEWRDVCKVAEVARTDSKQILADWMREQLGDSIATLKFGGGKPHFSATVVSVNSPPIGTHQLFKQPECLK